MLSALKDIFSAIALTTVIAFANGDQKWIWQQLTELRREAIQLARQDWGCPSIFSKNACR
jgi:hypothetical protein